MLTHVGTNIIETERLNIALARLISVRDWLRKQPKRLSDMVLIK